MLLGHSTEVISDLASAYSCSVPHLFMHYSFCLKHLLLTLFTWNPLTHPSRCSIITSSMKLLPNSQVQEEVQPLGHPWVQHTP